MRLSLGEIENLLSSSPLFTKPQQVQAYAKSSRQLLNDADAAGVAEAHYGEAVGQPGLTILTTLGTGIGSAMLQDGVLIPNSELGHMEFEGVVAESFLSAKARERAGTDWEEWASGLERFYRHLIRIFSPDLFLVGGGVSKTPELFMPYIDLPVPIRIAGLQNNAGILGVAHLADHDHVRILADDGAKGMREIQADRRLRLDLVDALELVFHWVF